MRKTFILFSYICPYKHIKTCSYIMLRTRNVKLNSIVNKTITESPQTTQVNNLITKQIINRECID